VNVVFNSGLFAKRYLKAKGRTHVVLSLLNSGYCFKFSGTHQILLKISHCVEIIVVVITYAKVIPSYYYGVMWYDFFYFIDFTDFILVHYVKGFYLLDYIYKYLTFSIFWLRNLSHSSWIWLFIAVNSD